MGDYNRDEMQRQEKKLEDAKRSQQLVKNGHNQLKLEKKNMKHLK